MKLLRCYLLIPVQFLLSVVSQIEWFDLINEVLVAVLITPMYSILNRHIKEKEQFTNKVFQYGVVTFILYSLFFIIVCFYVNSLVGTMFNSSMEEMLLAEQYLKLETLAFLVGIIFSYTSVVFVVLGKSKYIYSFVVIKTIALILSNSILIPKYGSSGIAYSNILTNGALGLASMGILIKHKFISFTFKDFKNSKLAIKWIRIGCFQGFSVLIANIAYSSIVVKMINNVQGLGDYWVANNFIWGWLLLPTYALAEVIKSECKEGYSELNTKEHYKIIFITVAIWILSIPLWNLIFKYTMGIENPSSVFWIVIKSLPFYIAYFVSSYIQSIFQGIGKTEYCFASSLAVNSIYYGILFIFNGKKTPPSAKQGGDELPYIEFNNELEYIDLILNL